MKKSATIFLYCTGTLTMMFSQTYASDEQYYSKGDWEVGLLGSYTYLDVNVDDHEYLDENFTEDRDIHFAQIIGGASYFFTDAMSFGLYAGGLYIPGEKGDEARVYGVEGNLRYHLQLNDVLIPYAGLHAGYAYGKIDIDNYDKSEHLTSWGLQTGLKVPINSNVYFDTQLRWSDYDLSLDSMDMKSVEVLVGLGIRLSPEKTKKRSSAKIASYSKGDIEVFLGGGYQHATIDDDDGDTNGNYDGDGDFLFLGGGASYFLSNQLSVGAVASGYHLPRTDDYEGYAVGLEGNLRYHFRYNERIIPYMGPHVGYAYSWTDSRNSTNSEKDDIFLWGLQAGFKAPITNKIYFDTQLKWTEHEFSSNDQDLTMLQVLFNLGMKL
jgi:opacity protein-like surface antigen